MKAFFKTLVKEHSGLIGPRLSIHTLTHYATVLATAYGREKKQEVPASIIKDVHSVRLINLTHFISFTEK
jgi:hypothetical protein